MGLSRRAAQVLHHLIDFWDPLTGRLDPSQTTLAAATLYEETSIRAGLRELRAANLVEYDGRRRDGGQYTSNVYTLTPRLFELARSLATSGKKCRRQKFPTNRSDLSSGSGSRSGSDLSSGSWQGGKKQGQGQRQGQPPPTSSVNEPNPDSTFTAFVAIFWAEREAKYGVGLRRSLRAEEQDAIGSFLRSLEVRARGAAAEHGIDLGDRDVGAELGRAIVTDWLNHPGRDDYLTRRKHPLTALVDDVEAFGSAVLERWCKALRKPRAEPPKALTEADPKPRRAVHEPEFWTAPTRATAEGGELAAVELHDDGPAAAEEDLDGTELHDDGPAAAEEDLDGTELHDDGPAAAEEDLDGAELHDDGPAAAEEDLDGTELHDEGPAAERGPPWSQPGYPDEADERAEIAAALAEFAALVGRGPPVLA